MAQLRAEAEALVTEEDEEQLKFEELRITEDQRVFQQELNQFDHREITQMEQQEHYKDNIIKQRVSLMCLPYYCLA